MKRTKMASWMQTIMTLLMQIWMTMMMTKMASKEDTMKQNTMCHLQKIKCDKQLNRGCLKCRKSETYISCGCKHIQINTMSVLHSVSRLKRALIPWETLSDGECTKSYKDITQCWSHGTTVATINGENWSTMTFIWIATNGFKTKTSTFVLMKELIITLARLKQKWIDSWKSSNHYWESIGWTNKLLLTKWPMRSWRMQLRYFPYCSKDLLIKRIYSRTTYHQRKTLAYLEWNLQNSKIRSQSVLETVFQIYV